MEDEVAIEPGAVATRPDDEPEATAAEPVFKPRDFRLNLEARLAEPAEPLTDLDSPAIRTLTWEHVVPDRPASSAPSAATIVPLPPPSRVVPPAPPRPAKPLEPPPADAIPVPEVEQEVGELVDDDDVAGTDDKRDDPQIDPDVDEVVAAEPVVPEVNRLALVPDLVDDDDSLIELPPITPSGPI